MGYLISALRPNSLVEFKYWGLKLQESNALKSLKAHKKSLNDFSLSTRANFDKLIGTVPSFPKLRNLYLSITACGRKPSTAAWLLNCNVTQLTIICRPQNSFHELLHLLNQVSPSIRILNLSHGGSKFTDTFCYGLKSAAELEELRISAPKCVKEELTIENLNNLLLMKNLRTLYLHTDVSLFEEEHLKLFIQNLPKLEVLDLCCSLLTDSTWKLLKDLKFLRRVVFSGKNEFTVKGLESYITELGHDKRGMFIGIVHHGWSGRFKEKDIVSLNNCVDRSFGVTFTYDTYFHPDEVIL